MELHLNIKFNSCLRIIRESVNCNFLRVEGIEEILNEYIAYMCTGGALNFIC